MDGTETLVVNALGAFEVWLGSTRGIVPTRTKAKALLAYLTLQRGTPVSRERLIEVFWPDADPRAGRANLNTALWDIRRALRKTGAEAESALTTTQSIAQIAGETGTDVSSFVSLAASGNNALLREAFALYRGDFLEGDYCEWSIAQRENLASTFEDVQARLLWSSHDPALARGLIARNPYHEEAYAILIEHELQASRIGAARDIAARAKGAMAEVDAIPSGALARALRAAAGSDIGRKLKSRIPTLLTTYLGRESELAQTAHALSQTRLLTLTGPGGVGKTRLAIRLAGEVEDRFPDGTWFVDFSRVDDPDLIARHLCETLGLLSESALPYGERLVAQLGEFTAMLIFDNCEHLVKPCAALMALLLKECPALSIVATSRVPIGIPGETVYRVPPLSIQDAVSLFIDRARLVERSFTPASGEIVRALCKRLDNLPFAIELAAARISIMTAEQLLAQIENRFELLVQTRRTLEIGRHMSLLELVNWSYQLLPEEEQYAMQLCAVFPSDFSLEAFAEACADSAQIGTRNFEILIRLTDKSLVLSEPNASKKRYRLLETTKQFCQERLIEAGRAEIAAERHARYYFEYARKTNAELANTNVEAYVREIQVENDNLRAALTWSLSSEGTNDAALATCVASLMQYWRESGEFEEGRSWIDRILAHRALDAGSRAWLHVCSALLAQGAGNFKALKAGVEDASPDFESIGEPSKRALFCYTKALSLLQSADHDEARIYLVRALEEARTADDRLLVSDALNALANIAFQYRRELEHGSELFEEALRIARDSHAQKRAAVILLNLGMLFEEASDFAAAIAVTQEAVEICDNLPGRSMLDSALIQLATYEDRRGDFAAMRARLREALEFVRSRPGLRDRVAFVLLLEGCVAVAERAGRIDEAGLILGFSCAYRDMYDIGTAQARFGGASDSAIERMRSLLGARAFEALRARGRLLSNEQAFGILDRLHGL